MLHWFALAVPSPNASLQPADDVRALRELVSDVQYELEQLKRHQMEAELAHSENIAACSIPCGMCRKSSPRNFP